MKRLMKCVCGSAALLAYCGVMGLHAVEIAYENRIDLSGVWNLEQVGKKEVRCPVTVPGDVHTALYDAKLIPDPYYSAN